MDPNIFEKVKCSFTSSLCNFQVGENKIVKDVWLQDLNKCMFKLGTYSHNPLKEWLRAHEKENYPTFTVERNSVSVDWGLAEQFNCNSSFFNINSMVIEMKQNGIIKNSRAKVNDHSKGEGGGM